MEYHLALKMEESSHMLKQCVIPIIRGIKIVKFIEAESRIVVARGWEEEEMSCCSMIQNFSHTR